jgi:CheY-like chemotaxis protein/HPt (histidine-containing phosphotransfer) domain-containing protein
LRLLRELLAIDHHRVAAAQSGESAIEWVAQSLHPDASLTDKPTSVASPIWEGDCDLVLMDLNLPGRSGIETVTALRGIYARANRREPIYVALSASTLDDVRGECSSVGMTRFLSKPTTLEQLRALVSEVVKERAQTIKDVSGVKKSDAAPVLDETALARLLATEKMSSERFVDKLVDEFLSILEDDVNRVVEAISSGDKAKIRKSAHALTGAALTVGARRLASTCQNDTISAETLRKAANDTRDALIAWQQRQD